MRAKRIVSAVCLAGLIVSLAAAGPPAGEKAPEAKKELPKPAERTYTDPDEKEHVYLVQEPSAAPIRKDAPILVYLHGAALERFEVRRDGKNRDAE